MEIIFLSKNRNFMHSIRLRLSLVMSILAVLVLITLSTVIFSAYRISETYAISRVEHENRQLLSRLESLNNSVKGTQDNFEYYIAQDNRERTFLQMSHIHPDIWSMGIGGGTYTPPSRVLSSYTNSMLDEIYEALDVLQGKCYLREKSVKEIQNKIENNFRLWAHIPSTNPVPNGRFSSGFGYRVDPIKKNVRMHWGIDLGASRGTPIYAPGDGVVSQTKWSKGGYGWIIDIDHGYGFTSRYAHCYSMLVKPGDVVKRGQIIATVGSTGRAIAPHLHYETVVSGVKVNPRHYINQSSVIFD